MRGTIEGMDGPHSQSKRRPAGRPPSGPIPDIGLSTAKTTPERYQRLLAAMSEELLTPPQVKVILDVLDTGLRVSDQIEVERRLVAAEQKALEAARIASSRALPVAASKATVDVTNDPEGGF
jgi:hypothetical protein